ncbi:MAG: Type 1 glutamine amidotransferase-like domain-containing protein [Selenomonadaceae bacterium]|nr:Type 1 glutamine amidotransferase-like domain-containing protein [Selenomonadaceae bacterium]
MTRYYCSGFDINNAFGHGLGEMFLSELKDTKSIVYIPGGADKIQKVREKYVPAFTEHFKNAGIEFNSSIIITPEMNSAEAQKAVKEASFIMLMGGDPFKQKEMCEKLGLLEELKKYDGVLLGFSAGAMLMSKYIIITPCSEEYPDFHIEEGLNLDGISIYPHNNTNQEKYPNTLVVGDETFKKEDFIKVSNEYGEYYLLQDYLREDSLTDVSIIKSTNGSLEFYTENDGRIWLVKPGEIILTNQTIKTIKR